MIFTLSFSYPFFFFKLENEKILCREGLKLFNPDYHTCQIIFLCTTDLSSLGSSRLIESPSLSLPSFLSPSFRSEAPSILSLASFSSHLQFDATGPFHPLLKFQLSATTDDFQTSLPPMPTLGFSPESNRCVPNCPVNSSQNDCPRDIANSTC